jgi:hypothetical protein
MNPPFGEASVKSKTYIKKNYPNWGSNILAAFFQRMLELLDSNCLVGAIFDRTVAVKSSYEKFRISDICGHIDSMADTGWNVLDANVETTTMVLRKESINKKALFFDIRDDDNKETVLSNMIMDPTIKGVYNKS